MSERRLRQMKSIPTEKLEEISEKLYSKMEKAVYDNIANAVKANSAERIITKSYYILHVQQEFRDYCKIISGSYFAEKELCDICECVNEFCAAVKGIIKDKGIRFIGEALENPAIAYINRRELNQALSAIVLNSLEHTAQGGKIEMSMEETARTIKISVFDTGGGMDEETLRRCMEPLFTGMPASGSKEPLGLGLTLARFYIQDCGGKIRIKSHDGKFTKTEVVLPKPKDLSAEELHSMPGSLSGYDSAEIMIYMAPAL